ncbi:MAG: hypothetical protein K2F57_05735, partial [Candidatus Gastranaerophilales bacterium]|nr:hypothetical protein [Candidatus Gastranaerophilales bacterium]
MQNSLKTDNAFSDFSIDFRENFYRYRTDAEFRQRNYYNRKNQKQDVTLDIIYEDLKNNFCLTAEQCERVKQLEIQTELENVVPIKKNIERFKAFQQDGKRIVLISDMYLPEFAIRKMLEKCALKLDNVNIYISSIEGTMKESGNLFKVVKLKENIEYKNWTHIGDNYYSDYINAKTLGIQAEFYQYEKLKGYEKKLLEKYFDSPFIQLIIGYSKNIRLDKFNSSDKYHLGASLAGPLFYPYVSWILKQAQARDIKCLYFVARDGYVLKAIADVLIKKQKLDIKTIYIYGSKKAWRVPSLDLSNKLLTEQFVETLLWEHKKLDKNLGLTYEEVCECIPKQFHDFRKNFSLAKTEKLKRFLLSDGKLLALAVERNKEKRANVISYLRQMLELADGCKFAFVDIDGTRFSMNCMSGLVHEFYDEQLTGFYFANTPTVFEPIGIQYNHFCSFRKIMLGHVV